MKKFNQSGFSPLLPLILLLIVGGLSAWAALTIYNKPNAGSAPSPSPSQVIPETSTPSLQINVNKFDPLLPTNTLISSYQKTIIGKTTDEEIAKLSGLKSKQTLPDGSTEYTFKAYSQARDNLIITKDGKVIFERLVTVPTNLIHPKITDYTLKYGSPEATLVGSKYYGQFENFYLYPAKGVVVIGTAFTDEVDEIQVFEPTTKDDYLNKWGQDYTPSEGFLKEVL